MAERKNHRAFRAAALACLLAAALGAFSGCGKKPAGEDPAPGDFAAVSGPLEETPSTEKQEITPETYSLTGVWKVTNASQSGAGLLYDFREDGTVAFRPADFGALAEADYGSALISCLRTGTYVYDPETGKLIMDTELCGTESRKTTSVKFSDQGSEVAFSELNLTCRRTALTGLAVSETPSDLEGSWKNLSVPGGLDIITFASDGTISYTRSDFDSLTAERRAELYGLLKEREGFQYSFTDGDTISVYQDYRYMEDIRFVIYGDYLALVTWDESGVSAATYRRAAPGENTAPLPPEQAAPETFSVKMTSMNYPGDGSKSHIACTLPMISGAPAGSDAALFGAAMDELLAEVTNMIAGDTGGRVYEISSAVYRHGGSTDIVMQTVTGAIGGDTVTTWTVRHFDPATGKSLSTGAYGALFGLTEQDIAGMAVPLGADEARLAVYFDLSNRLYAIIVPEGSTQPAPVQIN